MNMYNPFMNCGCNSFGGFNTGFKLGIFSNFMNMLTGSSMNFGYQMPSYGFNLFPSLYSYTSSLKPQYDYKPDYNYPLSSNYSSFSTPYDFKYDNTADNKKLIDMDNTPKANSSKTSATIAKNTSAKKSYTNFKLDKQFINRVKEIAKNINCDYKDLLAVMNSESGINPHKWNGTQAVGLIQFTDISLADIKRVYGESYTKEQVAKMSGMEQLDLVEKYLKLAKSYSFSKDAKLSAGDLYAVVFAPTVAGNEVLYKKGSAAYAQNPLDLDGDEQITKSDLAIHLKKKQVNLVA